MRRTLLPACILLAAGCAVLVPLKVGPPTDVTIEYTPERIARGDYLANSVMFCTHCHSDLNWDYYAGGLPEPDNIGGGGYHIVENAGLIGSFDIYAGNITPAAVGDWTDGELIRAIVEGINRDGKPLFPVMPYERYRHLDPEDLYAIVAYTRSLAPVENTVPEKKVKRMMKVIERTFPGPYEPRPRPDPADAVAYGEYMATISDCIMCHSTRTKTGKMIEGMGLAGGNEFLVGSSGVVFSANISPDPETGIGDWSKEDFIDLFKSFAEPYIVPESKKGENTAMPWVAFAGMTEEDLGAIYEYIMSVPPVNNPVEPWPGED